MQMIGSLAEFERASRCLAAAPSEEIVPNLLHQREFRQPVTSNRNL